jgi:GrpB-like predicted nucleotidyltransferase (UPF0157 family)
MYHSAYTRIALGCVCIAFPDPLWPDHFSNERELLRPFLGSIADVLQHYGRTAIPGLKAKLIIDMMAPVVSLRQANALGNVSQLSDTSSRRWVSEATVLRQKSSGA